MKKTFCDVCGEQVDYLIPLYARVRFEHGEFVPQKDWTPGQEASFKVQISDTDEDKFTSRYRHICEGCKIKIVRFMLSEIDRKSARTVEEHGSAYLVDCNAYSKEPVAFKTVSEALAENRIVSVSKEEDGRFCVKECCDNHFRGYLTREQLLAWADELRALAGMPNDRTERPGRQPKA